MTEPSMCGSDVALCQITLKARNKGCKLKTYLGFDVTGVVSTFCSGGDRITTGCGFAPRPVDDDVGVFPDDDDVGVLLAIAAHVIGFAGFTANNIHFKYQYQTTTITIIFVYWPKKANA